MSRIEDEISQVMADHDRHAPGAADLLRVLERMTGPRRLGPHSFGPPRRLARWYVPLLAAAAVAAVVAGSVWAGGLLGAHWRTIATGPRHSGQASPLSCPARYAGPALWVPAPPSGVDGRSRLVPRQVPRSALLCAYTSRNAGQRPGLALSGHRVLAGGLGRLAGQLSLQPREMPGQQIICSLVYGPQTVYLVGLAYPGGGAVWVAASDPADCVGTSNGHFTSFGAIGPTVQRAFRSGRWPFRQRVSCNGPLDAGRRGQETVMVPAGSTSLVICAPAALSVRSGYQALVAALDSLPTRLSTRGCSSSHRRSGGSARSRRSRLNYQLLFSYPIGPPVRVDIITGCYPEIDNYSLQADNASIIIPIINRLLRSG